MVVTIGWGIVETGKILVKGYNLPVLRQISSVDLMYSMIIILY